VALIRVGVGLSCLAVVGALTACGGSNGQNQEAAGESYLQDRLERLFRSASSDEIVVLCREAGSGLACGTLVGESASDEAAIRQRWRLSLDRSGKITAARLVSSQRDTPAGPPPELRRVLEEDAAEAAAERRRDTRAREARTKARTPKRTRRWVQLRIVPRQPVFVCVVDGAGRRRISSIISRAVSFRGRRLRLNLGSRAALVTVNGRRLEIPSSPYGIDLRPDRPRPLGAGSLPCG
jgi:hypothetical protein